MLRKIFETAAYTIAGFILVLGSFYFIETEGIKNKMGYIFLGVGLIHIAYLASMRYLFQKSKLSGYLLLFTGAACILLMALFRMSLEYWETPLVLLLVSLFIFLSANQLQGKIKLFPQDRASNKTKSRIQR